jgi:hypothetical protein
MLPLVLTLALAAPPKRPWTSFKPDAWAQYVSGSTEFRRGALSLVKVEGSHVTIRGSGGLENDTGWEEAGVSCPACVAKVRPSGKRTVKLHGKTVSCELFEFRIATDIYRECRAAGFELPLQLENEPIGEGVGYTITATATDVPVFVSGSKLSAFRYEGTRTSGATMTEVRSSSVPGGLVMQLVENAKTGRHDLRVLEAFGVSGKPVDGEVTKSAWHPWASHPVGTWVKMKSGSKIALAKATDTTISFEGSPNQAHARGEHEAASDPTSSFMGVVMVKIEGREHPCVMWMFQGKDQSGGKYTRRDCLSPFSRVPLYSEEEGSLAGVSYFDTWVAQTLEVPGKVGKHAVALVTLARKQKISNGASSKADVVMSPDVPGGTVTWTSHLELNGVMTTEVTQEAVDFGKGAGL